MNRLKTEKRIAVATALVEGNSIRSTERMTSVHRDTIVRLLQRVGSNYERIMDERMRDLECRSLQADEIWGYIGKKQPHLTPEEKLYRRDLGDMWVFVAQDADTKLIPVYEVGKRDMFTTRKFMFNLAGRLAKQIQLITDAFTPYDQAVDAAFGA